MARDRVSRTRLSTALWLALSFSTAPWALRAAGSEAGTLAPVRGPVALNQPIAVYNNWSAYDELSDDIELTEALAMKELDEIVRLRRSGVRVDYYVMDAFWYATNGGFREFRRPHWPAGPERWLAACREHGIRPGLWFPCNVPFRIEVLPEWRSSMDATGSAMCFFDGGFLPQFMDTLQFWYDRGVRLYKFDFANFTIATPAAAKQFSKEEIYNRNCTALRRAVEEFKKKNPEALFAAFNGFGGDTEGTAAPVLQTVDLRWLEAFDSLYSGDPRLSDVPMMNFWRSMDLYSDHMVRYYEGNGVPLERIDNTGCMFGVAGTCYGRRTRAWKSMLLLEHARGGWMNVYYGNLELIDNAKATWFAKVQRLFLGLQAFGRTYTFGAMPGQGEPYGFCSIDNRGSLYTVVNPSQAVQTVRLPRLHRLQPQLGSGRLQFHDAGFGPKLSGDNVTLGPEELAVIGYGAYASGRYDLGVQEDASVPNHIERLSCEFLDDGTNTVSGTILPPTSGKVRVLMRQASKGKPVRTSAGAPPNGTGLGSLLRITAAQMGKDVPVAIQYDKALWSGLSWAAGEIDSRTLNPNVPLVIRCSSFEKQALELSVQLYLIQ